jgi:hypothetical protein
MAITPPQKPAKSSRKGRSRQVLEMQQATAVSQRACFPQHTRASGCSVCACADRAAWHAGARRQPRALRGGPARGARRALAAAGGSGGRQRAAARRARAGAPAAGRAAPPPGAHACASPHKRAAQAPTSRRCSLHVVPSAHTQMRFKPLCTHRSPSVSGPLSPPPPQHPARFAGAAAGAAASAIEAGAVAESGRARSRPERTSTTWILAVNPT